MVGRAPLITLALVAMGATESLAAGWRALEPLTVGARFEYRMQVDRDAAAFPWNTTSGSARDRTRLMLDLSALDTGYGSLYIKGAALRDGSADNGADARFRFEQADYLWVRADRRGYAVRLFANQRRLFVNDMIAPLIDDDRISDAVDNRGLRFDGHVDERVSVSVLYSRLGNDFDEARGIAYLRGMYAARLAVLSASYLFDDPGVFGGRNHALFKTELSSAYKSIYGVVSYQQSAFKDESLFFPGGSFHFDRFDGDNFSAVLPQGSSLVAEARLGGISLRDQVTARLVYRYTATGSEFVNDLGQPGGSRIGHTAAAYFRSRRVSLDGRLRYRNHVRVRLESEEQESWEAAVWGMLRSGVEFFVRGAVGEVKDQFGFDSESNFIHLAVHHRMKKMRSGAHVMWKDLDTIFSERRFGWDGKLAFSPDWGLHWRFTVARGTRVREVLFSRLEYRPNNRVYATFGYGRDFLGDAPYLLEDDDLSLSNPRSAVYTIAVRGDF